MSDGEKQELAGGFEATVGGWAPVAVDSGPFPGHHAGHMTARPTSAPVRRFLFFGAFFGA
jgi:hypothetical protein